MVSPCTLPEIIQRFPALWSLLCLAGSLSPSPWVFLLLPPATRWGRHFRLHTQLSLFLPGQCSLCPWPLSVGYQGFIIGFLVFNAQAPYKTHLREISFFKDYVEGKKDSSPNIVTMGGGQQAAPRLRVPGGLPSSSLVNSLPPHPKTQSWSPFSTVNLCLSLP